MGRSTLASLLLADILNIVCSQNTLRDWGAWINHRR